MPFVASTSKHPTAVLGAVSGFFLGNGESLVLLNRLNVVSLFSETAETLEHLRDFTLFASLKYVEALPLFDSKGSGRHVAFLFSVKQEVSIVAFERSVDGTIEMITLFHGDVDTCFYQERPNEASLCCSGSYQTSRNDVLPLVTFSIHRGSVFLFDVAAAIAVYGGKYRNASLVLEKLFSPEYAQQVLRKQKKQTLFVQGHLNASELDVRSMIFGPCDSEKNAAALYVLYADSSSKTHVSEYSIHIGMNEEQHRGQKKNIWPWLPNTLDVFSRGDVFRRKAVFLANVETNACLLQVNSEGLFVLGPQLISFVSWRIASNQSTMSKNVTTLAFPSFSAYVEPVCSASLPNRELLIFFWDGTYVKTTLQEESEGLNSNKMLLVNLAVSSLRTIPDSLAILGGGHCVIGSRMTNTLWLKWRTGESGVLLENCGPVFDLTIAVDGPRMGVIASTGVGMGGGVSLQRSAVNFRHDAAIDNLLNVTRLFAAGDIVILSFPGYSRVYQFQTTPNMTTIKELSESPFDKSKVTLSLVYVSERNTFVQVTSVGVNFVKGGKGVYIICKNEFGIQHASADANLRLLVFSSSRFVSVVDLNTHHTRASLELDNEVSCLVISSSQGFVIGEWNSGAVCLYEVQDGEILLKGRIFCSATSCSMCILSHLHTPRLVVGLLNGYIADISLEAMLMGSAARETLIRMQPVQLFNLESHNAVLCLGEVPLIIILCDTGFQLTGIDFNDVAACAIIEGSHISSKYIFLSQSENSLAFGNIVDLKKLNSCFLGLKATVTRVKYIAWWNVFVMSVRRNEKDQILLLMGHELANSWVPQNELLIELFSIELLGNERCVFFETVVLGGSNESPNGNEADKDKAILLGTTFAFPDEQLPRSSRFIWYSVEQGKLISERPQLRQIGSKDVEGALQCCCIVPNYVGRIALGVNGCIALYSWNAADSVFVAEETICIGTIVTRVLPIFQGDASYMVAFDARHSCFFIQVDTFQGSLEIVARDSEPRGVMDGAVFQLGNIYNICFGDDYYNFFCLSRGASTLPSASNATSATVSSGKLETSAQYHLGDMVTAMQLGSFAPCSVTNIAVPIPTTLIPGICGPQVVFGTSHGAFGTITPVSNETYLLLKALEVAVSSVVPALGGFEHVTYREVLRAGQERGYSRNASFENANVVSSGVFDKRRKRYLSRCVCSGDLIESFLTFSQTIQQRILREAESRIKSCYFSMNSSLGEFFEHNDLDNSLAERSDACLDECKTMGDVNALFSESGLPTLPLTREAVNEFLQNLQRIH